MRIPVLFSLGLSSLMGASLLLTACVTGPGPGMLVETVSQGQALSGANCTVSNGRESWNVVTPASIRLNSGGDLRVWCEKPGYRTSELVWQGSGDSGWWGPSVGLGLAGGIGGRTGLGLGLSFPLMGGRSAGYPARVTIEMNPQLNPQ